MNPDCYRPIIEVGSNSLITATFEIAHIYPHSDDGPRWQYLADAPADRDSLENLIILCLNCHQKVDSHPEQYPHEYPPGLLIGWKVQHKERIRSAFQQHMDRIQADTGLSLSAQLGAGLYPGQKGLQSKIFTRHALFGGREAELERLDRFLRAQPNGYLFVTGLSGFGKTALLANWIQALEKKNVSVAYHFISRTDELADERSTFLDLCEQLAAYHGFQGILLEEPKKLRALFPRLLGFPAGSAEKLVIVLDGLDEATDWKPISALFPSQLPVGVYFVFSARETGRDWLAELELSKDETGLLRLTTLDLKGISNLLQQAGEKAAWAGSPENLGMILKRSKGDPFYLQYLVKDIQEGKIRDRAGLEAVPEGVDRYLEKWWLDEVVPTMDAEVMVDLVGYLTVARGSLRREELIYISPTDKLNGATVDRAIASLARYVVGDPARGYTLCHPRFRDFLTKKIDDLLPAYRQRVLDYCARWSEHQSAYALAHYAAHLAEEADKGKLYQLISKEWKDIKFARYFNHQSFSYDVELAIQAAEEEKELPEMVRLSLLYATLGELATNVPPEILGTLALCGQVEMALGYAALMQGLEKRSRAYRLIGQGLLDAGDTRRGKHTLEQALAEVEAIEDEDDKAGVLGEVAQALARAGDWDKALAAAEVIESKKNRADIQAKVAEVLAQVGDWDGAFAVVENIDAEWYKAQTLNKIVNLLVQGGDQEKAVAIAVQALSVANRLDSGRARAVALGAAALAQARSGDRDGALVTGQQVRAEVAQIEHANTKEDALQELALLLAQLGDHDGALVAIEGIQDEKRGADTLIKVVQALAQAGFREGALNVARQAMSRAEKIEADEHKAAALGGIAEALSPTGNREEVEKIARRVLEGIGCLEDARRPGATRDEVRAGMYYELALSDLAPGLAQVGDREGALAAAERIGWGYQRSFVLSGVTYILFQAGDWEGVTRSTRQALDAVKTIRDPTYEAMAISELAQVLAQSGDLAGLKRALAAAEEIWDASQKARTMRDVVQALAQAGDREAAFAAVQKMTDAGRKVEALSGVAEALVQAGEMDEALATVLKALGMAERVTFKKQQATALSEVARALAQAGEREGAFELVDAAWDKESIAQAVSPGDPLDQTWAHYKQIDALSGVAHGLAAAGDLEGALETVEKIENETTKKQVLSTLALMQAQAGNREGAFGVVNAIGDDEARLKTMAEVARTLAEARDRDGALEAVRRSWDENLIKQTLSRGDHWGALGILEWEKYQGMALIGVAQVMAQTGDQDGLRLALALAEAIRGPHPKALALVGVAQSFADIGDEEGLQLTLAMAEKFEGAEHKATALSGIAKALEQAGDREEALGAARMSLAAAGKIEQAEPKAHILPEVARSLARCGDVAAALDVVEEIKDDRNKAQALSGVLQTLAQVGDWKGALQALEMVKSWNRAQALGELAQALEGVSQRPGATGDREGMLHLVRQMLEMAKKIRGERTKADALLAVGGAIAQVGDREGLMLVLAAAETIAEKQQRSHVISGVAQGLTQIGAWQGALDVVAKIGNKEDESRALSKVAELLIEMSQNSVQAGSREEALQAVQQALKVAGEILNEKTRADSLTEVAQALATQGDLEGLRSAWAVTEQIKSDYDRSQALSGVAGALAQAGLREAALTVVGEIGVVSYKVEALIRVAGTLAQKGDREGLDQVLAAAEAIKEDQYKVQALSGVVQALAQAEGEEAPKVFRCALHTARMTSREAVFDCVSKCAPLLADLDQGKTLQQVYHKMIAVDSWWESTAENTADDNEKQDQESWHRTYRRRTARRRVY